VSDATIYDVRWADLNRFQSFLFDLPEPTLETFFQFAGVPLQDSWSPQPIYSHQPRLQRPSFWHLFGTAVIVMDQEVIDLVGQFIYPVGELLSLRESGTNEQFYALNILRDIDCLNPHAYRIDELDVRPDFIPHRLDESGLFKVPQLDTTHIFYLERSDDDASLIRTIELRELTGLRFDPVWTSRDGPKPINLVIPDF
jgi:hypothetical protein